jgi:hypothetical protein
MAIPQAITDTQVLDRLASVLKKESVTALLRDAGYWSQVANEAHGMAVGRIWRSLQGKGYTAAQIQAWDEIQSFERILAVGEALALGGGISADTMDFMRVYDDYRTELVDKLYQLLINGVWVAPQSTPGTFQQGQFTSLGNVRNGVPVLLPSGNDWEAQAGLSPLTGRQAPSAGVPW